MPTQQGSFRLFQIAGVEVFLHWSWFLIAAWETTALGRRYVSPIWGAVEYLALFLIVILHEFGHALACRQVGGRADKNCPLAARWPGIRPATAACGCHALEYRSRSAGQC